MRFQCDFCKCCPKHIGSEHKPCRACGHGACWHKRVDQFGSTREHAHRPSYKRERLRPMVPELPRPCVFALIREHARLPHCSPCVVGLPV